MRAEHAQLGASRAHLGDGVVVDAGVVDAEQLEERAAVGDGEDGGAGDFRAAVERELEQLRRMAAEGLDAGVGYIAASRGDERRELGAARGQ